MIDVALGLFGPLAGPEVARAARRPRAIWLRLLPAAGAGLVLVLVTWFWSLFARFDANHLPYFEVRTGLTALVGGLVVLALAAPPAVLAGSLAGEKERGSIGLLLTTQASAADIVLGRWVGRMAQVGLVAAASLPMLVALAALAGVGPPAAAMLVALPLAVGLGGGGLALGFSAVSRRGRDALLLIYLVDVLLLVLAVFAPRAGAAPVGGISWWDAIGWGIFNPFACLVPLIWGERAGPAAATAAAWAVLGAAGLALASWRLRASCLSEGARSKRPARRGRWRRVPPVGDRPMLWKELYIERAGSLGRAGRWVGGVLVAWLALGSATLGLMALAGADGAGESPGARSWFLGTSDPARAATWATSTLAAWYGGSAGWIEALIEVAIGLRAAVTVASERERGTWDGLMTSPLDGRAILRGKLWGSVHALRALALAALVAWTITWAAGGMSTWDFGTTLVEVACLGTLMAAAGVALSLRSATATRAMGATLAAWLAAFLGLRLLALCGVLALWAAAFAAWTTLFGLDGATSFPMKWVAAQADTCLEALFCGLALLVTAGLMLNTRLRFDRLAGRMVGGAAASRLDEFLRGRPMAPVALDRRARAPG